MASPSSDTATTAANNVSKSQQGTTVSSGSDDTMRSVQDEIKLLRNENQSLQNDVKTLKCDVNVVKTLLLNTKKEEAQSPTIYKSTVDPPTNDQSGDNHTTSENYDILLSTIHKLTTFSPYKKDSNHDMLLFAKKPIWGAPCDDDEEEDGMPNEEEEEAEEEEADEITNEAGSEEEVDDDLECCQEENSGITCDSIDKNLPSDGAITANADDTAETIESSTIGSWWQLWGTPAEATSAETADKGSTDIAKKRRRNARKRWRKRKRKANNNQKQIMANNNRFHWRSTSGSGRVSYLTKIAPPVARVMGRWKRSIAKITLVGLISITLLVSMTLGQGTMGITHNGGREDLPRPTTSFALRNERPRGSVGDMMMGESQPPTTKVSMTKYEKEESPSRQQQRIFQGEEEANSVLSSRAACLTHNDCRKASQSLPEVETFYNNIFFTKGCYSKRDKAFFSLGTTEEMSATDLPGILERIWCNADDILTPGPTSKGDRWTAVPSLTPTMTPMPVTRSPACECDADPKVCGCPHLQLSDYRGSINVTLSNYTCQRWDSQSPHAHSHSPQDYVDIINSTTTSTTSTYLEENYCRNVDNDANGAWCYTTDPTTRFDYCSVPMCGVLTAAPTSIAPTSEPTSLEPTASPTSGAPTTDPTSVRPTSSAKPSVVTPPSLSPSQEPTPFVSNIPSQEPTSLPSLLPSREPSSLPSTSSSPTQRCPVSNTNNCGCKAVSQSDYRGSIHSTEKGTVCERWDADWIIDEFGFEPKFEFPNAGLEEVRAFGTLFGRNGGHNYCRNPTNDTEGAYCLTKGSFMAHGDEEEDGEDGSNTMTMADGNMIAIGNGMMGTAAYEYCDVPTCDPCSCMPPCGKPNLEPCGCPSAFQAEECCSTDDNNNGEEDSSCKCGYLKEACRKSLENNHTAFCDDAEVVCCETNSDRGSCKCDLFDRMCSDFPFAAMCDHAANSCCSSDDLLQEEDDRMWASAQCLCDYYTYTSITLGYGDESQAGNCSVAAEYRITARSYEEAALEKLYQDAGGYYWYNKTGWLDDKVPHCKWFGLSCNDEGLVTEIDLRGNNLGGGLPSNVVSFAELTMLDLAENKLAGSLNSTKFWKLRYLTSIDISMNDFSGHADMYFGPAMVYVNYSRNRFTSVGFKRFNAAYDTMSVVDMSNNLIDMEAVDFFRNVPVNVTELNLSNNTLRGAFPDPFPFLGKLTRFTIANNDMAGPIPWGLVNFTDLTVLDFSGNKLSQGIPPGIGYLEKLTVLNLSSNALDSSIPGSLGRLEGVLEMLDLSNNELVGRIPSELGALRETIVLLGGNSLTPPAPLGVCKIATVKDDQDLCPPEIKMLEEFYHSFKGPEWINNRYWLDESKSYCLWYGVVCDKKRNVSITKLELGNNGLSGELGTRIIEIMSELTQLEGLDLNGNDINGTIPTEIATLSNLVELDLSYQKQGLTGEIPDGVSKLVHLSLLCLAGNKLDQSIPSAIGKLEYLKVLNLSSNVLSQSIPTQLRRLQDTIEILDLSNNKLEGRIPSELGDLQDTSVHLSGNDDLSDPAPLTLCLMPEFDLFRDTRFCPPERNILREIYVSANGQEWTKSGLWLDEYESHCNWYGVECNKKHNTVKLELYSNGLSGTLNSNISSLGLLEVLDLSDNDIKGSIPTEIGLLSNLNYLRLSYNLFIGNETNFGNNLKNLELIQLHGNRLSGSIPSLDLSFAEHSSFIADCGNPSDFDESLLCEECTMCCNAQGDCYPQEDTDIQALGFDDYVHFTWFFFACIFGITFVMAMMSFIYDKCRIRHAPTIRRLAEPGRDTKYALDMIGDDSVYQFFLGKSWFGWFIVLATMSSQMWMLFLFVQGAEIDLSNDNVDLVYTWKCSRDQDECRDTADLDWKGWVAFSILMVAHLLKDIINGSRMVVLSGKERHDIPTRIRLFFGGTLLGAVSIFTFYVSSLYNGVIATSNTEIILNSVVILFICDVDELLYDILIVINSGWVKRMTHQGEEESVTETNGHDEEKGNEDTNHRLAMKNKSGSGSNRNLEGAVERLERQVQILHTNMDMLMEQNAELKSYTQWDVSSPIVSL